MGQDVDIVMQYNFKHYKVNLTIIDQAPENILMHVRATHMPSQGGKDVPTIGLTYLRD